MSDDVFNEQQLQSLLKDSEERFRRAVTFAPYPIMIHADDGEVVLINHIWTEITGYTHEEIPTIAEWTSKAYGKDMSNVKDEIDSLYENDNIKHEGVFTLRTKFGKEIMWEFSSGPIGQLPDGRRLVISMASDITERFHAEEEVNNFFEQPLTLHLILDFEGMVVKVNKGWETILGYNNSDLKGVHFKELVHPDDLDFAFNEFSKLLEGENLSYCECTFLHANGTSRNIAWSARSSLKHKRVYAEGSDITDHKQAEESLKNSEERLRYALDATSDGLWDWDIKTGEVFFSDRWCKSLGYKPEEVEGDISFWEKILHPDDSEGTMNDLIDHFEGKTNTYIKENRLRKKSGEYRHNLDRGRVVDRDDDGKPLRMIGTDTDITEHKNIEKLIKEGNRQFNMLFDQTAFGVARIETKTGRFDKINKTYGDIVGYSVDELLQFDFQTITLPEDLESDLNNMKRLISGKIHKFQMNKRYIHKDGSTVWVSLTVIPLWENNTEPDYHLAIISNITTQKNTVSELSRITELLINIINASQDFIFVKDTQLRTILCNKIFAKALGKEPGELYGNTDIENGWDPDFVKGNAEKGIRGYEADDLEALAGKTVHIDSETAYIGDETRYFNTIKTPLKDEAGNVLGVLAIARDINDRKKSELELYELDKKLHAIIETSKDWIWEIDLKGNHTYSNPAVESILGYSVEELMQEPSFELMHVDDRKNIEGKLPTWISKKSGWNNLTVRWKHKNGTYRYIESNAVPILDQQEELIGFRGVDRDVTERMMFEESLQNNEERYRVLSETTSDIIWTTDKSGGFIEPQLSWGNFTGQSWSEHKEFGWTKAMHPDDMDRILSGWKQACIDELQYENYGRIWNAELNHWRHFELKAVPIMGHDGVLREWVGIINDVTERKQAEKKLIDRTDRLIHNQKALLRLGKMEFPNLEIAFDNILKENAGVLKVERVGVWIYNNEHTEIESKASCIEGKISREEIILKANKFPLYFKALSDNGFISADNARTDPRTKEFLDDYLIPLGITSMLDVPIRLDGEVIGIICHEHVGEGRAWSVEDIDFANSIADMCALAIDINERKRMEENLSQYNRIFEDSLNEIYQFDNETLKFVQVNHAAMNNLGYSMEELMEMTPVDIKPELDLKAFSEIILPLRSGKQEILIFETVHQRKDGSTYNVEVHLQLLIHENSKLFTAIILDISDRKRAEEKLTFQASHDALTGLINRREFERRADRLLSSNIIDEEEHALCYMDLDQFKVINDTCGHVAGDEMLRQLSVLLTAEVRHRDTLARLGGDEFAVLMEHCSLNDAKRVATSLQKAIQDYQFSWEGHTFRVGVSIGLAPITTATTNITELLKDADAACYMAKDKGRNRIHVYHAEDAEIARRHGEIQWVERINQALENDLFCLYAQIIESLSNKGSHYELLIRMLDENDEIIPPGAFLPAAERYNLISKIDRWVIECTFKLFSNHPNFIEQVNYCAINLSGQSITDIEFHKFIRNKFKKSNIPPEKICFEITETAAISNMSMAKTFISEMKALGCQFSLDDFGSGLSSFGYLKNMDVDYLKIDGMFVKDIADDPIDHAMVKSINEIGQVMGMETIAEFVENDVVKGMLKEIGVNYVQGFGIGKPQPFMDLLEQSKNK
jgi:diguanylate cyclase (GGDEF)-like protein/PAS domain S-box-containing protein